MVETAEKMELSKWRPIDWARTRIELASIPMKWSPSGPNITHAEQIVEATASRILEELDKNGQSKATSNSNGPNIKPVQG